MWPIVTLDEIALNLDAKRIPITKSKRKAGIIPYYGASGVVDYVDDYLFDEELLLVSEDGANLLARTYPIAFSIEGKTWVNNHAHVLRFEERITRMFVEYYLNSIPLTSYVTGMAQPKLNQKQLNSIAIPLPPIPEQQQIVTILDQAFADIEKARANAEQNLKNARELFDSYLQQVFSQRGEGWVNVPFSQCFRLASGNNLTSKNMIAGDFPVYGGNEIAGMHKEFNLHGDNVIIGRVGALCGNARHIQQKIWLTDNAFKIVDFKYDFDNAFLTYMLNFNKLRNLARQAAQPVISNSSLKDLALDFPISIEEQRAISSRADWLFQETSKLTSVYINKQKALEELKKSLLQKAFSGELTKSKGIAA